VCVYVQLYIRYVKRSLMALRSRFHGKVKKVNKKIDDDACGRDADDSGSDLWP